MTLPKGCTSRNDLNHRWTPADDEHLKEMWTRGGFTASEVARTMHLTKNAIIGRVHRLKLPLRVRSKSEAARMGGAATKNKYHNGHDGRGKGRKPNAVLHRIMTAHVELPPPQPIDDRDRAIPLAQRRTLIELTDATCRWPVGVPGAEDFFFCGARVDDERPYCAGHARIAYQQAPK